MPLTSTCLCPTICLASFLVRPYPIRNNTLSSLSSRRIIRFSPVVPYFNFCALAKLFLNGFSNTPYINLAFCFSRNCKPYSLIFLPALGEVLLDFLSYPKKVGSRSRDLHLFNTGTLFTAMITGSFLFCLQCPASTGKVQPIPHDTFFQTVYQFTRRIMLVTILQIKTKKIFTKQPLL